MRWWAWAGLRGRCFSPGVEHSGNSESGTRKGIARVRAGEIGTVRFFNSSFSQQVSGQNHRAKHGFWAGPVPDMGPYPLNAVRNLFGAEPIEVLATGVCTDPERFVDADGKPFDDTVAVTLKFEPERVAAFVLSYSGGDVDEYRVVESRGDLFSKPAYQVGVEIEHVSTVEKKESKEAFKKMDRLGGELKYFSNCILEDRRPEFDGQEGLLDVRAIAAVERSLETGLAQKLEPVYRGRRPDPAQVEELDAMKEGDLVGAHKPCEGQ